MKKLLLTVCILLPLSFAFSGCGTIMDGTKQEIGFSSSPSNAVVTIDGKMIGRTPLTQSLKRKNTHKVVMALDGYYPYEMTLTKKTNGWVWGNIVFGGLIGLAVDAATGSLYKLTPEQVNADLKSNGTASISEEENALYVAVTLEPDASWQQIGNIKNF
ncbi:MULTISPECIES: PEGA domain-containing protein [Prosthecochloris]|nr:MULTISPECIES: PEGA domain-containing protein [Prosthecochloris]UZJ39733.1 PEGA domain-containing protein [Prosthecochloris sp. SCSIO W1102]